MKRLWIFCLAALLIGCGQSGDLFLPPEPATEVTTDSQNSDDNTPAGKKEDDEKTPIG